jgi:hypothetical protein
MFCAFYSNETATPEAAVATSVNVVYDSAPCVYSIAVDSAAVAADTTVVKVTMSKKRFQQPNSTAIEEAGNKIIEVFSRIERHLW